jgi:hypothetical protein
MRNVVLCWLMLLMLAGVAEPQQQTTTAAQDDKNKKKQDPPPPDQQPKPLFGGKIPARSSQNTKESATLGFNGIDPSGKVDKKMLAANPKSGDVEKVHNMDATRPAPEAVVLFAKEGGLKTK